MKKREDHVEKRAADLSNRNAEVKKREAALHQAGKASTTQRLKADTERIEKRLDKLDVDLDGNAKRDKNIQQLRSELQSDKITTDLCKVLHAENIEACALWHDLRSDVILECPEETLKTGDFLKWTKASTHLHLKKMREIRPTDEIKNMYLKKLQDVRFADEIKNIQSNVKFEDWNNWWAQIGILEGLLKPQDDLGDVYWEKSVWDARYKKYVQCRTRCCELKARTPLRW